MKIYKIRDWSLLFETSETRKLAHLRWVPVPNKHDGKSFRRIASMKNSSDIFTAWMLILQIASKCVPRGTLIDGDKPIEPEDMAMMTGFPEKIFSEALIVLSNGKIDWIHPIVSASPPVVPADPPGLPARSADEGKEGMEGNEGTEEEALRALIPLNPRKSPLLKQTPSLREFLKGWSESFQRVRGEIYAFAGVKDEKAIYALLDTKIPTSEILLIAEGAWRLPMGGKHDFERGHSLQISSFASQFNKIRAVVSINKPKILIRKSNEEVEAEYKAQTEKGVL